MGEQSWLQEKEGHPGCQGQPAQRMVPSKTPSPPSCLPGLGSATAAQGSVAGAVLEPWAGGDVAVQGSEGEKPDEVGAFPHGSAEAGGKSQGPAVVCWDVVPAWGTASPLLDSTGTQGSAVPVQAAGSALGFISEKTRETTDKSDAYQGCT